MFITLLNILLITLLLLFFRGILLAEEQRYSEAVQSYQHAIHFRPRLAGEHSYLCGTVNKLMSINEKTEGRYYQMGAQNITLHSYRTLLNQMLASSSTCFNSICFSAAAHLNLGIVLADMGHKEEAVKVLFLLFSVYNLFTSRHDNLPSKIEYLIIGVDGILIVFT